MIQLFSSLSAAAPALRAIAVAAAVSTTLGTVSAQPKYGPGATDTEIKLGQTAPYSGPASSFSVTAKVEEAFIKMINARGGINGRKINLVSLDDGYSPPKTVEQTRKLVESEEVLALVGTVGTLANVTVAKYLNAKKVPQLLGITATDKLENPAVFPWTTTFFANQGIEGRMYARYLLTNKPDAKIAVLYENDDYGKGYLEAFKAEFGEKASSIVEEEPYEVTAPTIESQVVSMKTSGADVAIFFTTPKFTAQAIRKAFEIGWTPLRIIPTPVAQITSVLKPAGLEASTGILTASFRKELSDPQWENDQDVKDFRAFMKQWAPDLPVEDGFSASGYLVGLMLEETLKRCGDDLTRDNLLKQATSIKDLQLPIFLPGIKINISNEDRVPWRSARISKFDGKSWQFVTDIMTIPAGK
jgi:branched-chain amino acid transport system substrate-binding protein